MNKTFYDPKIYPGLYEYYIKDPFQFRKEIFPHGDLLITTISTTEYSLGFILSVEDMSTGTPKPIISKTGSFWKSTIKDRISDELITIDNTEILRFDGKKTQHYRLVQDSDQQSGKAVNNE